MTDTELLKIRDKVKTYIFDKLNNKENGIQLANEIEEALYEDTMKNTALNEIKTYRYQIFKQRYNYGLAFVVLNMVQFENKLKNKEIIIKNIFNKNPIYLFPDKWEDSKLRKAEEDKFLYDTHLVSNSKTATCFKCNTVNVFVKGQQTRSADEPETIFYLCLTCGNQWKK